MKDRRYLDFEELEDLEKIIEIGLKADKTTTKEKGFLADMGDRLNTYGERLQVTDPQWKWVVVIAAKVGLLIE